MTLDNNPEPKKRNNKYLAIFMALIFIITSLTALHFNGYLGSTGKVKVLKVEGLDKNKVLSKFTHELKLNVRGSRNDMITFGNSLQITVNEPGLDVIMPLSDKVTLNKNVLTIPLPILQAGSFKLIGKDNFTYDFYTSLEAFHPIAHSSHDCLSTEDVGGCMAVYFHRKVFKDKNARPALTELLKLTEDYPQTLDLCHNWSHAIGEASAWYNGSWEKAMANVFDVCHFGYYHGVQEGLAAVMETNVLKTNMLTMCNQFKAGQTYGDCAHGLGHVAYWRAGGNYKRATDICRILLTLPDPDKYLAIACMTGITMSWSDDYLEDRREYGTPIHMYPKLQDTFDLCKNLDNRYLRAGCYEYINPTQMHTMEELMNQIPKCNALTDTLELKWCWLGFARDAAWQSTIPVSKMVELCQMAKTKEAMWGCFDNTVHSKTVTTHKHGTAKTICQLLPKSVDPLVYPGRCQSLQDLEDERFNAEGRDESTGVRQQAIPKDQAKVK
jgi:hypothetical protein